ncbi:MAG: pyrroline-5-carboxylate reductase [Candidatus Marinimicrobia bacterium]|nr:pyrroline-5-carboxylate reductase [Candidatus Neomarinimicrobiota bacterium]
MKETKLAILGAGNIGTAMARGFVESGLLQAKNITLTRRHSDLLESFKQMGYQVTSDNISAVNTSTILILSVEPHQAKAVMQEIAPVLHPHRHTFFSVVSGLTLIEMQKILPKDLSIVRVMPNTAIAVQESMTCLSAASYNEPALKTAETLFNTLGQTLIIEEEQMSAATALGACGIAFFLRAIRAASQGGIEVGFQAKDALKIAAQTAKGAAKLIQVYGNHPEQEIDKVTTPLGCTIAGLNEMEHEGFSSAMIKGIKVSAERAEKLYQPENSSKI